jgi:pimeloyl-ACP methyl ester carboxylesterase
MSSSANPGAGAAPVAKNLQPASYASRYVEAAGLKLHYLDYGTPGRPSMLCVHGGAAHAHWFDFVAPALSADYHVRALDLRGHGDSQAAEPPSYRYQDYASDLAAAIEKLDLRDFVLVGHSMGGMVSLVYAAGYPGRVSRLIVADSTMQMGEDRVATLRDVGTRQGSVYATQEELVARYRLRPSGTLAMPETVRYVAAHSSRQSADGTWRHKFDRNVYARRENIDGMPYWDRIRIPALIVKGDHSPRISPEIFAEVKARCPQVELAEVPQSDHHVTLDNPPGFVDAVRPFLSRHG